MPQNEPTKVRASHSTGYLDSMSRQNSYVRSSVSRPSLSAMPRRREEQFTDSGISSAREPQLARGLSRLGLYQAPSDPYSAASPTPSAVNLKTGSSVFSLDFPPPKGAPATNEKPPTKSSKPRRKTSRNSLINKEERTGRRNTRTRTSVGGRSDEDALSEMRNQGNGPLSVTSSVMSSRSERPAFLLDSDEEASNDTEDEFITKVWSSH